MVFRKVVEYVFRKTEVRAELYSLTKPRLVGRNKYPHARSENDKCRRTVICRNAQVTNGQMDVKATGVKVTGLRKDEDDKVSITVKRGQEKARALKSAIQEKCQGWSVVAGTRHYQGTDQRHRGHHP